MDGERLQSSGEKPVCGETVDFDIGGRRRRLRVFGPVSGESARGRVLALHGFTGAGADFAWPARRAAPGWAWLCPDLPGHGGSCDAETADSCALPAMEAWLAAILKQHPGPGPLLLAGYSMGGRAAMAMVAGGAVKPDGMVLVGASPGLGEAEDRRKRRAADEALAQRLESEGLEAFLQYWHSQPLIATQQRIPAEIAAPMRTAREAQSAAGLAASLRGFGTGSMTPLWDRLGGIDTPVLLVAGEDDTRYTRITMAMAEKLPRARVEIIPGAGHMAHLENASAFAAVLRDYLSRTTSR